MNSTSLRRYALPGVAALALVTMTACGASNETATPSAKAADTELTGTLNGAGASSQEKAQEAWRTGFQGANGGDVTVNYDPVGSGDGRKQFIAGGVSFAGSDSYLSDDEGELAAAKERCLGEDVIEVPAYVSPIAVIFNVEGVDALNLSAKTIAQIFDGKITTWNDPAIAAENEGAELPDLAITPVHRADDSGTTKNFTDYLGKAGEGAWSHEAEDAFPVKGGEAAEGTSGVVTAVTNGKGTIGYADASQAGDLSVVSVKVGDEYVAPSAEAAAKIIGASPAVEGRAEVDMAVDIDRETTESGVYPVVLASYLLACQHYEDAAEADLVKGYLSYVLSDEGQQAAAENAGSAPLTGEIVEKARGIVDAIAAKA